tara:strand:+ start:166 stop:1185 length:1020 start_codon:yes stop_codon:yes gene_type:complete
MSKKNSSVSLKGGLKETKVFLDVFSNFKRKLDSLNQKKYLVAVSGGPDSLALVALARAYSFYKKIKIYYVLVDHNIRKDSGKESKKVKRLLKKNKIDLKIFTNKRIIVKNIQAEARDVRYEILLNYCKKHKIKVLITAHNLEDQVETFFMRLSRGSGLKGLSSMRTLTKMSHQVRLFRPLLDTKKNFLIKISKSVFGTYFKDPSNDNHRFLRTKVRNLKRPLEKSGIKYDQIFRSIKNLSISKDTLDQHFSKIFKDLIKKKKKEIFINYKKYSNLNKDTKIALINESIKQLRNNYYDLRSKKVENLIKNFSNKNFKKSTLGGCIFFKKKGNLCLKPEKS